MEQSPIDTFAHPALTLRIEGRAELTGRFDTGSTQSFISLEWLKDNKLFKDGTPQIPVVFQIGGQYIKGIKCVMRVQTIGEEGFGPEKEFKFLAVIDFAHSPLGYLEHAALFGRDVQKQLSVGIELEAATGNAKVIHETWQGFEQRVADLYRKQGYKVSRNYNLAGNQIDILLEKETKGGRKYTTIVECKFHRRSVGVHIVRELAGLLNFAKNSGLADHAILVSSAGFTKDAYLVSEAAGIDLVEIEALTSAISKKKEQEKAQPADGGNDQDAATSVFVAMPFSEDYRDIYMLGIREVVSNAGLVCMRVDEIEFSGRVISEIFDQIRASGFVVAEVTEPNPNVFYEVGIAHALDKTVVLCTKNSDAIPFDLRDQNHIVYRDIVDLRERLNKRISSLVIA